MPTPILATKLYIPPLRPKVVLRPRLIERLNEGLRQNQGFESKLTLISAPAGFGKTTLVSEWISDFRFVNADFGLSSSERMIINQQSKIENPKFCWLSLDAGDNDPARFLTYLIAALQTIAPNIEAGLLGVLQSPQPPPVEPVLTSLLNEIAAVPDHLVLVLDDYYMIDARPVEDALTFLLEHLPPHMHLVIATREDPQLPLARLRARGQLTELRAADLRFTPVEAADFLNRTMGLNLSAEEVAALEARTEGWIAGLQLAALALQGLAQQGTVSTPGHPDTASFIQSFTGSHHFVMDYLVEEVLHQQPESIQTFLLRTSILDRFCGPLCEAVVGKDAGRRMVDEEMSSSFRLHPSSFMLDYLERANLFIIPLDNERRWYRYHHLFADLLRQRLQQHPLEGSAVAEYHIRASQWFEENGLAIEAFHHAAAAQDIERAARLVEGGGMPLLFRGAVAPVVKWLESLSKPVLDARPSLWVIFASAMLFVSKVAEVEEKLQAAEAALLAHKQGAEHNEETRDLIGHIASIRATVAAIHGQPETIIAQSRRALAYLRADNLPVRTATIWTLGCAYQLQGDRAAASQAFTEAIAISEKIGHFIITLIATLGLGQIQETQNQFQLAAQTYKRVLQLAGDPPLPVACEAHLGLARICYQWNDVEAAQEHAQQSLQLARQIENTDRFVSSEVFLARLKLARGDVAGAAAILEQAAKSVRQYNYVQRLPELAAAQVRTLLHQGDLAVAAHLAQTHELPPSQARVHLAQGEPSAALAALEPYRRQVEARDWKDERLKVMVLQAVAFYVHGEKEQALRLVGDALALAEPGGFIRIFLDEGEPMRSLILDFRLMIEEGSGGQDHSLTGYLDRLLATFAPHAALQQSKISNLQSTMIEPEVRPAKDMLVEPLSPRELEVLRLIAQGLSNREISERLFLALSTVKGHNRIIFDKLQVQRRTEAVARARELGLLY